MNEPDCDCGSQKSYKDCSYLFLSGPPKPATGIILMVGLWNRWYSAPMSRAGVAATKSIKNAMGGDVLHLAGPDNLLIDTCAADVAGRPAVFEVTDV